MSNRESWFAYARTAPPLFITIHLNFEMARRRVAFHQAIFHSITFSSAHGNLPLFRKNNNLNETNAKMGNHLSALHEIPPDAISLR